MAYSSGDPFLASGRADLVVQPRRRGPGRLRYALGAVSLLLVGLIVWASIRPSSEQRYLTAVRHDAPAVRALSKPQLTRLAKVACADEHPMVPAGPNVEQLLARWGVPRPDLDATSQAVRTDAVRFTCPQAPHMK